MERIAFFSTNPRQNYNFDIYFVKIKNFNHIHTYNWIKINNYWHLLIYYLLSVTFNFNNNAVLCTSNQLLSTFNKLVCYNETIYSTNNQQKASLLTNMDTTLFWCESNVHDIQKTLNRRPKMSCAGRECWLNLIELLLKVTLANWLVITKNFPQSINITNESFIHTKQLNKLIKNTILINLNKLVMYKEKFFLINTISQVLPEDHVSSISHFFLLRNHQQKLRSQNCVE